MSAGPWSGSCAAAAIGMHGPVAVIDPSAGSAELLTSTSPEWSGVDQGVQQGVFDPGSLGDGGRPPDPVGHPCLTLTQEAAGVMVPRSAFVFPS